MKLFLHERREYNRLSEIKITTCNVVKNIHNIMNNLKIIQPPGEVGKVGI